MKSLAPPPGQAAPDIDAMEMNAECFVSPRYAKKHKTKQVGLKTLTLPTTINVASLLLLHLFVDSEAHSSNPGGSSEHRPALADGGKDEVYPGLAVAPRVWNQLLHRQVLKAYLITKLMALLKTQITSFTVHTVVFVCSGSKAVRRMRFWGFLTTV